MATESTCPPADVLEQFLLGKTPGPDTSQVEEHLGRCAACAESLEAVRAVDRLVEVVRQAGDGDVLPPSAVVRELVERVVL